MVVLEEVTAPTAGVALWQVLQDVMLWAGAPADRRGELFRGAVRRQMGSVPGLESCLPRLNDLLREARPGSEEAVGRLCLQVSEWAEQLRVLGTALAFAEAAAQVCPRNGTYAYRAGKLARRRAEYPRAEVWFRRAIVLGRRSRDRKAQAYALSGLGNLYRQKGDFPAAVRCHARSLRLARRHGLRDLVGDGYYALCVLAFEVGDAAGGQAHAQRALAAYGPTHPKVPTVAHDVAWFWMTRSGAYPRALRVFRELQRHVWEITPRLVVVSNVARAAGGAGEHVIYEQASGNARTMMARMPDREGHASSFLHLAYGAAGLGRWAEARAAAEEALEIAVRRQEHKVSAEAEALLAAVTEEALAEERLTRLVPSGGPAPNPEADELAGELLDALRTVGAG